MENPRQLLDKFGRKPVAAVVEHVRDGSTVRLFLTPSFHYVTLMMSGIRVSVPIVTQLSCTFLKVENNRDITVTVLF